MSRVPRLFLLSRSSLASDLGHYALYVCAMGTVGVAAVQGSYVLSENVWHAAAQSFTEPPRAPSRVEKYLLARANESVRAEPGPYRPVVALVKPAIHPAVLAAAMDRTELASAHEFPEHHRSVAAASAVDTRPLDMASWREPAARVAGVACVATGCRENEERAATGDVPSSIDIAQVDTDAADIGFATSSEDGETLATEQAVKQLPRPYRLGKGTLRQKPSRKSGTQFGNEPAVVKFFTGPGTTGLRVAETPGDIISRTLSGTI